MNVTEHARSEPPLRNWEEALQTAKTPRSCLRCSSDLRYRFVSRACAQMFGREPKDFRETLHAAVTPYPTAEWAAQRIVEWCARDLWPPRFLIHDRDSHYGATFECRLRHVGIEQVRTPFRAPRANAISERWVKSVRAECLDHLFIFNETGLRRVMASYVSYFNHSRPHRSANARRAIRQRSRLGAPAAKSSRKAFSADCITSIGMRHNGQYFCALQRETRVRPARRSEIQRGFYFNA